SYRFAGLQAGVYRICVFEGGHPIPNSFTHRWGGLSPLTSPGVSVAANQVVTGIDVERAPARAFPGQNVAQAAREAAPAPIASGRVTVYRLDGEYYYEEMTSGVSSPDATFAVGPLVPGQYRVRFSDTALAYGPQYWQDERYFAAAVDIEIVEGEVFDL